MPVPTTELGLQKALDSDDTADYLDTSLASSLTTLDSLFNNVSGHTHGGAHQGGPITNIPISAIPDGSITSAKITDGTIVVTDLDPTVYTLGGDLNGTVQNGHVILANSSPIYAKDTASTNHPLLTWSTDNNTYLYLGTGGNLVFGASGGGSVGVLTSAGNLTINGALNCHLIVNNNNDIQQVRSYYGMNNSIYLTNDGVTWTFHGPVTHDTTITAPVFQASSAYGFQFNAGNLNYVYCDLSTVLQFGTVGSIFRWVTTKYGTSRYFDATISNDQYVHWGGTNLQHFATAWGIEGSSYAYINQGRSANELGANVHLYVPGNIVAGGTVTPSTRALKANIAPISDADCLARVTQPGGEPVSYEYTAQAEPGYETMPVTQIGFVAEDLFNVVPEAVVTNTETGAPAGVLYSNLTPLLWGAVRALSTRLSTLEAKVP